MHARHLAGAAALAASILAATGAAAEIRECRAVIQSEAARLNVPTEALAGAQQARNFYPTEGQVGAGLQTFLYPSTCRGAVVIETGRGCAVEQIYATGQCTVPRGR